VTHEIDFSVGEELTIYIIIWSTFLTASLLVREDSHVRADLLMRPERQRWFGSQLRDRAGLLSRLPGTAGWSRGLLRPR
jgi:hypothetical protein